MNGALVKILLGRLFAEPARGNGVIVQVTVNDRTEHAYVWVEKSDRTLSFSPNEIDCGNWLDVGYGVQMPD